MNKLPLNLFWSVIFCAGILISCKKNTDRPTTPTNANPVVTTASPSSITASSAISGGTVSNNGGADITERGICFSLSASPTVQDQKITSGSGDGTFTCTMTSLTVNSNYYVKAYVVNSDGVFYGNEVSFHTQDPVPEPDPATLLFISGGYTNKLLALNPQNGNIKWTANLPAYVTSSPVYSAGRVFVGCEDNKIYAFDTLGVPKWSAPVLGLLQGNAPIIGNTVLYISGTGGVTAFDPGNGAVLWTFSKPGASTLLIYKNNTVYFNADSLYAIDATNGSRKWAYRTGGQASIAPVVFTNRTYVISYPSTISLLNTATGAEIWKKPDYTLSLDDVEGLNVKNGNIYGLTDDLIILDSADGSFKSSSHIENHIYNNYIEFSDGIRPIFVDSLAIIPAGSIYVRDAYTGLEKYTFAGAGYTGAGCTLTGTIIYYTNTEHEYYLPDLSSYYAGTVSAFDYKTRIMKWTRQFVDHRFIKASPCVVTVSGKGYRGGVQCN